MNPFEKDWSKEAKTEDVTDITFILDRSGSMESIRGSVVKGIADFIAKTMEVPGTTYWNMIQFDDHASAQGAGEKFPQTVFEGNRTPAWEQASFKPRGGTALIDAVCLGIKQTRERLDALPEKERKSRRILMVIMTDGQENSSHEFNTSKLRELIAEHQTKLGWEFLYLGANQEMFSEAANYGMARQFNYAGLGNVVVSGFTQNWGVTSGSVSSGQVGYNSSVLPFTSDPNGVAMAMGSGIEGAAAWKRAVPDHIVVDQGSV